VTYIYIRNAVRRLILGKCFFLSFFMDLRGQPYKIPCLNLLFCCWLRASVVQPRDSTSILAPVACALPKLARKLIGGCRGGMNKARVPSASSSKNMELLRTVSDNTRTHWVTCHDCENRKLSSCYIFGMHSCAGHASLFWKLAATCGTELNI